MFDDLRSQEQNDRMWAMLRDVAKQVLWTVDGELTKLPAEDWKQIFTAALKREMRMAKGLDGGVVMLGASTRKMRKQQMSDLMDLMTAFGSERGIAWSDPKTPQP